MDSMVNGEVFDREESNDGSRSPPPSNYTSKSWKVSKQKNSKGVVGSTQYSPGRQRKKSFLNPPDPVPKFGCKGHLLDLVDGSGTHLSNQAVDPSEHFLEWEKPPVNVVVIKKIMEKDATRCFKEMCQWLIQDKNMTVYVEEAVSREPSIQDDHTFAALREKLVTFGEGEQLENKIDFIICLGGDGTLLYASALFQLSCPPVMAFHLGSLGFLTSFRFENFRKEISRVLAGPAPLTLRSRLRCATCIKTEEHDKRIRQTFTVLNEVVIDRGPSSYLCNLDIYCNDRQITAVQGDGVIISSPTGSTAYALAAGASMVHPSVPAILITPICPHSLSFRPIILPAGVEILVVVNKDSRHSACVSFDGRNRQELRQGDSLSVSTSIYPLPSVNSENQTFDWFKSLAECFHWNVREKQRNLSSSDSTSDLSRDSSSS